MMSRRAVLSLLLVAGLALAVRGTPAGAQLGLGGSVPSELAIQVGKPTGFVRLVGGSTYELRVPVEVTATDSGARLSISDGQDFKPPARGHLRSGSHLVSAPLQALVAGRPAQLLSAPVDPILGSWNRPVTLAPVTITLRQALPWGSTAASRLHKIVVITVSGQTP